MSSRSSLHFSSSPESPGAGPSGSPHPIVTVTIPKDEVEEIIKAKKKKVGFARDPSPPREAGDDYFDHVPIGGDSANNTPGAGPAARRDSFDRAELTEALEKILKPEDHSGPPELHLPRPRPALRKSRPASPAEPVVGLSHPSEIEARYRAGRLAESVSALASRRNSIDSRDDAHDGLLPETSAHDWHGASMMATGAATSGAETDLEGLIYRKKVETEADRLVRKHTQRRRDNLAPTSVPQTPDPDTRSRPATPVAYDLEYVPPAPAKYHGGILGSLLKLYNNEEARHDSGTTTPDLRTPRSSPPSTTPGTPRVPDPPSRPRSGLFGLGSRHSASTLAELIGSTSTLVAPASAGTSKDWSEAVASKVRQEREKPKKGHRRKTSKSSTKTQQLLVTKHIAVIISRHRYLVKLCRALMEFGAPTHRLEAYMAMSARVLGIEGQFLYLPGCMIISFDDTETHTTEVKIVRTPQGVDLGKLHDVHEVYKLVVHDLISVDDAMFRLDAVINKKQKYNKTIRVLVYGLAAVTVAPFAFEGRWIDMPIAFVMGCILGVMQLFVAPSSELYANVFEISASLLMAFLGRMFGSITYHGERLFCFSALAQSSIALILPGYMVLCGSLELQSHNMVAGSVRMVYAMIYTLFLGYGVTIGATLYGLMDQNAVSETTCENPLNSYWDLLFVPLFTVCLCIINQAKVKQMPVMLMISFAGYVVNSFTDKATNSSTVSNTLGALTIGVLANIYSRVSRHAENFWLDLWEKHLQPRIKGLRNPRRTDPEAALKAEPADSPDGRRVGYGLAAAAMLPAIFVQVPSGIASAGSLVAGVLSANAITGNTTAEAASGSSDLSSGAFSVLGSVIQVAISISVGLSLAALLVYPFGKRRSGLFSF
ncbi:hypothetical protein M406DRAFT_291478 [Cryphonectria parasitica EP155]|uniref:Threonine/serine exporter-like N-terminal domain-containing protein n=1 Tax=Cryphonectria parasitica (strain ATCC 38755 / EP155) TaxID=660469 RepID=A0A9P5CNR9_CRYP1|nr:uncharacterized protein M406DRAFT_291478 [Cryphonectria parasitica EP155]KAF3764406.1 hypothetical protein M406DRAFT_291478 [Cryphonectria parasitica EP155]